jgi:hypothetical protein
LFRTALTDFVSGHGKSLAYVGTALALTGLGTATAAAATSSSASAPGIASAARHLDVGSDFGVQHGSAVSVGNSAAGQATRPAPTAARHSTGHHSTGHHATAQHTTAQHATAHVAAAHKTVAHGTAARHQARRARVHLVRHSHGPTTWKQVRDALARQTYPKAAPGKLPLSDRLQPGPASGGQAYIPITASRMANATTIVRQALSKHMGLRSAVIAVATAMQESTLENLNYGDRDSLGLFQQRPSAGWGTPAQVTDPTYAADAFLNALHGHQQADPGWAGQPLWANAQAVQNSGFPYAYAKWESQAAQLVSAAARHLA